MKIEDFIRARNPSLTPDQANGVKARLVFAGLAGDLNSADEQVATGLFDNIVEKMRQSQTTVDNHADVMSTAPKLDAYGAQEGEVLVALINNRVVRFKPGSNVVTPLKVNKK